MSTKTEESIAPSVTLMIRGVYPLIFHNGQMANPMNRFAKVMKSLAAKRNKDRTDDDREVIARLEWWAGLYLSEAPTVSDDGAAIKVSPKARAIIPSTVLASVIAGGARKLKRGKDVSAGVLVDDDAEIEYDGPKDINELALDERFWRGDLVKVGNAKVLRTRPTFVEWSLVFSVSVDPDIINPEEIKDCLAAAGKYVGIGDWRPGAPRGGPFGRFRVEG